jgi:hypothetical protein
MPIGLLAGMSVNRALSLGFYLIGAFLTVAGFFVGNRGPFRARVEEGLEATNEGFGSTLHRPRGGRALRSATPDEQFEAMAVSAVFVLLGFTLMAVGILIDSRVELV